MPPLGGRSTCQPRRSPLRDQLFTRMNACILPSWSGLGEEWRNGAKSGVPRLLHSSLELVWEESREASPCFLLAPQTVISNLGTGQGLCPTAPHPSQTGLGRDSSSCCSLTFLQIGNIPIWRKQVEGVIRVPVLLSLP